MNEYIFYTTEGHTFAPLENKIIENCQILGTEFGHNIDDSKKTFLNNNTWIKESGFNPEEIISMQVFTNDIKQDIQKVIQFLMNNNLEYLQCCKDQYLAFLRLQELVADLD